MLPRTTLLALTTEGSRAAVASGDYRCLDCGYGVSIYRSLPTCPMCGGAHWEKVPLRRRRLLAV